MNEVYGQCVLFFSCPYCVGVQFSMLEEATNVNTSRTALLAILANFCVALPTRLPTLLIPKHAQSIHAAPRWKGLESTITII